MTRNGLPLLFALFTVLALVLCPRNAVFKGVMPTAAAQGTIPTTTGLIYDPSTFHGGTTNGINLGYTVDIGVVNGQTVIVGPAGIPANASRQPTDNLSGTVFYNNGSLSTAVINAGTGSVIRNNPLLSVDAVLDPRYNPAIKNGSDSQTVTPIERVYKIQITKNIDNSHTITYGYTTVDDPTGFYPLEEDDDLPANIADWEFPPLGDEPIFDDETGSATIPAPWILDIPTLTAGESVVIDANAIGLQGTDPTTGFPVTEYIPLPTIDDPGLEDRQVPGGTYALANMTINQRQVRDPKKHNHDGDGRTLIESYSVAIENHGTLMVNDSRIQTTGAYSEEVGGLISSLSVYVPNGVGILHEFSRGMILDEEGENVESYSSTGNYYNLTLNNTQIGEPTGSSYLYEIDPQTGLVTLVIDPETGMPVINSSGGLTVDAVLGKPLPTITRIAAGDHIMADGVNGRIISGHALEMNRNIIGFMSQLPGENGTTSGTQQVVNSIDMINGPSIGIYARAHSFDALSRIDSIYLNSLRYYEPLTSPGMLDTSSVYNNTIKVNDNSWIYANTGISFGNAQTSPAYEAIRVSIDSTSGIYAGGFNDYYSSGFLLTSTTSYSTNPIGITDRYSLIQLLAGEEDDIHDVAYGTGFSGSFHEIQVDGKVITGAPSIAGIQLRFQPTVYDEVTGQLVLDLSSIDKAKLSNIFYYDPNDEHADRYGNVYYYDSTRTDAQNLEVAAKFIAYNNQPDRVFWLRKENKDPVQLTYFDEKTQRWTVHPDAPTIKINGTGQYSSSTPQSYFAAFDSSSGLGIDIMGTSIAYEGENLTDDVEAWSTYFGPTVREITVIGNDALVTGGKFFGEGNSLLTGSYITTTANAAAMQFGFASHVGKVEIGINDDAKNLSDVLFDPSGEITQSVKNFQAFDTMTSIKRAKLLYNPEVLYDDNDDNFHFDNAGVQGDIVSWYNAVVDVWWASTAGGAGAGTGTGTGTGTDTGTDTGTGTGTGTGAGTGTGVVAAGSWVNGVWTGNTYSLTAPINSFWIHGDGVYYSEEALGGVATSDGPSYLLGHRDWIGTGYSDAVIGWTADDIPGRSLILDETLLYNLAGRMPNSGFLPGAAATSVDSFGYADNARHFREALAWFMYGNGFHTESYAGLTTDELLAGYTRDGTLITFSSGDIYSGNIYGGGVGDRLNSDIFYFQNGTNAAHQTGYSTLPFGNIDLRFTDGTTIFNRNVIELVEGSDILHYPGIRVRDVYIEETGHLMMNDAEFAVNPFHPLYDFEGTGTIGETDYDDRLIIHDVLNEGIVSGNGVFQIAQRFNFDFGVDYFEGYFINRGILAPGLAGFIGENEHQAKVLEQTAYDNMLEAVSNTAGDVLWEQQIRGVPGGQFGVMTIFGSLRLMDEHTAPVYDPYDSNYNIDRKIDAGEFHVTIGNDTVKDIFGKYVAAIKDAKPAAEMEMGEVSREDWKIIAMEKLGTHLSWFSTSAMIDKKTGLPLMSQYEQFEYLTDAGRRADLQRKMLETILNPQELQLYDTNPAQRAALNKRLLEENNIRFEFTQMDSLLWRYGFSDVVSVHGTVPSYWYTRGDWQNNLTTQTVIPPSYLSSANSSGSGLIGLTQLGGVVQADRIYDTDENASQKEKQTSFIIVASEGFTDGTVKTITSDTTNWIYANVDVLPLQMATGQMPAVLTVIDDPHFYRNRVGMAADSFNAKSVASTLDNAMLTNPGLAASFQFGLNSPEVLNDTLRQVASATRANSLVMNLSSPSDNLFSQIGYGHSGLSTGRRGDIIFRNMENGQLQQPYGQPAVPPPGSQFAPPMGGQYRGQSPMSRTGSIWGAYTHSNFSMGDDDNSFKYTFYRNGIQIGSEWNLTPSSVLGGVASLSQGQLQSLSDEVDSADYSFGLYYVAAPFEQFEVKSYLGGGYQSYKTDRYIRNNDMFIGGNKSGMTYEYTDIYGINEHYESDSQGQSFNYAIEFARPFTVNPNFVIRPAAGFEYQTIRMKGYSEQASEASQAAWSNNGTNMAEFHETEGATSGNYAMNYKKMDFSRSLVRFGVNTESYFSRGGWQFRGYYIHKLSGDRYPISTQSFVAGSDNFQVRGGELGNSYVQVGLGTHFWLNRDRSATLFFNGDWNFSMVNKGYSMLNLNTGLQLNF